MEFTKSQINALNRIMHYPDARMFIDNEILYVANKFMIFKMDCPENLPEDIRESGDPRLVDFYESITKGDFYRKYDKGLACLPKYTEFKKHVDDHVDDVDDSGNKLVNIGRFACRSSMSYVNWKFLKDTMELMGASAKVNVSVFASHSSTDPILLERDNYAEGILLPVARRP